MTATIPETPAPPDTRPAPERSTFLDALRSLALARVVLWHTFGTVALSYVAAMPLMLFVAGSLAGPSSGSHGALDYYGRRLRRLLPPLWAYAVVAWLVFLVGGLASLQPGLGLDRASVLWWIFPLWDPVGPEWAVAWWAPLWYLRSYLWLVLLTPLLVAGVRRAPIVTLTLSATAVLGSGFVTEWGLGPSAPVRDLILFGFFWIAGLVYSQGKLTVAPPRLLIAAAGVVGAVGLLWMAARPVPLGIVNASHTAHFLLGAAWILLVIGLERPITRIAVRPRLAEWIAVFNRRAVTIYLWHAAAAYGAYVLVGELGIEGIMRPVVLLGAVVSMTAVSVFAFGWVEDLAARRRPRRWPVAHGGVRRSLIAFTTTGAVVLAAVILSGPQTTDEYGAELAQFVPASGYGIELLASAAIGPQEPPAEGPISDEPVSGDELRTAVQAWAADWGVSGSIVAVRAPDGSGWMGAVGVGAGGSPLEPDQLVDLQSITKSYTAALILTLSARGDIDLDAPVSRWAPEVPHASELTVRELLYHRSGLGASGLDPQQALELARARPLAFAPGSESLYSDVGYFALGLIAERVGAERFTDLVHRYLLEPLDLRSTFMDEEIEPSSEPRHPGDHPYFGERWSAGGMRSTLDDTARWALGFWGAGLGQEIADEAMKLDDRTNLGAGTNGFCPCWYDEAGASRAETYGHLSPHGRTGWSPSDGLAIAVYTVESLDRHTFEAWADLDTRLRRIALGRELPGPS
jgi:CubicO group peptidase (beta-lactamase class C family)/peptidoglycan/LPS O-acetylase OafA/YrhL